MCVLRTCKRLGLLKPAVQMVSLSAAIMHPRLSSKRARLSHSRRLCMSLLLTTDVLSRVCVPAFSQDRLLKGAQGTETGACRLSLGMSTPIALLHTHVSDPHLCLIKIWGAFCRPDVLPHLLPAATVSVKSVSPCEQIGSIEQKRATTDLLRQRQHLCRPRFCLRTRRGHD